MKSFSPQQLGILTLAFVFAAVLHVAAFWALTQWHFESQIATTKPLWENQGRQIEKDQTLSAKELLTKQRNEEIAALFREIQRPAEDSPTLNYDTHTLRAESKAPDHDKGALMAETRRLQTEDQLVAEALPVELQPSDKMQAPATLAGAKKVEIVFPDSNLLTSELIRAAEQAQGVIEPQRSEQLEFNQSLKAGSPQSTNPLGRASRNQSGFIDQGREDSLYSTAGSLLTSRDATVPRSNSLKDLQALVRRELPSGQAGGGFTNLGTLASSDDFQLLVEYAPRTEQPGFVFRLELKPKPGVRFKRIRQNYFFLIDRSSSISSSRFDATKRAVANALNLLNVGDTFNILLFDDKIVPLATGNLPWNPATLEKAYDFLNKSNYGGLFSSTDLYISLGKIVPEAVAEREVNTAILFSDGDTHLNSDKQRDMIVNWTRHNAGKVTLYSVAVGKGNNLPLLDLLSVFNKGTLNYDNSRGGVDQLMQNLIFSIRSPIGKQISLSTVTKEPGTVIHLLPTNAFLPNLYENTPYVVYGTINRLSDFHIFFQGRYYDKYLDIKQPVEFAKAYRADVQHLEKKWALYQAYQRYAAYLSDGDKEHLAEAKQLLKAHRLPVAFE